MQIDLTQTGKLTCQMNPESLHRFTTLLQSGFYTKSTSNRTLIEFLLDLPGFDKDYVNNRLQTIFYNGDAIDDTSITLSGGEVTLALSAAMPGLAGAIFRKNSPHAGLRKSAPEMADDQQDKPIMIRVKLFNAVAPERGLDLLRQGVILKSRDLHNFLELRPSLREAMNSIQLDTIPSTPEDVLTACDRFPYISTTIFSTNDTN
ncbi:MAG: hypothetical protein D6B25_17935 [Desulfobulbaceae bacterium]|nr:MAG: hypothetical protein D6B25_17935 [Desulfobulbaceae bacterium]